MAFMVAVCFESWDSLPVVKPVDNSLEAMQAVVLGDIEHFQLTDELAVITNENGKIEGRPPVRGVVRTRSARSFEIIDSFNSPFFVVRMNEDGNYTHLTDSDIERLLKWKPGRAWGYEEQAVLENVWVKKEQFL